MNDSEIEHDDVALREEVALAVTVKEGVVVMVTDRVFDTEEVTVAVRVVVGVTDAERLAETLTVVDSLLEALQLPVSSIVSVGDGSGVSVRVSDDDGVYDAVGELEAV